MPRNLSSSPLMRPLVVLALPGMYLFYKYSQYKRQQQEQAKRRVTEKELAHLNQKIDKLLSKLEENEPEMATSQEDECVICVNAKATMQTSPCGHRVVCRKCFVKTIQMAVSQRLLPLRCVICRAKILRLKTSGQLLITSASHYSMGPVVNSESLYSMSSGSSSLSGVSSSSGGSRSSTASSGSLGGSGKTRGYRQPSVSLRKSHTQSMKFHLQEYKEPVRSSAEKPSRLPPIQEFQREYRLGKERSSSTRIRCAQKIVTQLETTPVISTKQNYFRSCRSRSSSGYRELRTRSKSGEKEEVRTGKERAEAGTSGQSQDKGRLAGAEKSKQEKAKEKELSKAEKKEAKKEAKQEKKNAKKEAKLAEKKEKRDASVGKKSNSLSV